MPELPEVQTVCTGLAEHLTGKQVLAATVHRRDLRIPVPEALEEAVQGRTITAITRRAKYICMEMDSGTVLIWHLGMSGRLLLKHTPRPNHQKHDHVLLHLTNQTTLVFNDPRRFGLVTLVPTPEALASHQLFAHLGPEPLSKSWTGERLHQALRQKKQPIKLALMDARVVVGVGNIYASESLFDAGIHPETPAGKLSKKACARLVASVKKILEAAIASGGSTLRDYVRSSGDVGYFQHHFAVYGRAGEACYTCATPILRLQQQNRSTFYCPTCQPAAT